MTLAVSWAGIGCGLHCSYCAALACCIDDLHERCQLGLKVLDILLQHGCDFIDLRRNQRRQKETGYESRHRESLKRVFLSPPQQLGHQRVLSSASACAVAQ